MYALAILRNRRPLEEVVAAVDEHRAYLRQLIQWAPTIGKDELDRM